MGPSNIHICSACGVKVCLRHRYDKEDHSCTGKKGGGPGRGVASWFGIGGSGGAGGGGGGGGHTHGSNSAATTTPKTAPPSRPAGNSNRPTGGGRIRAAPPARSAAETAQALRATADRRKQGGGGGNAGYPGQSYQDRQQQSVGEVVDLTGDDTPPATATAAATAAPGMNVDGGCPFCHALFSDPVALVAHVEAVHQNDQRLQGAGGGGEGESCCVG